MTGGLGLGAVATALRVNNALHVRGSVITVAPSGAHGPVYRANAYPASARTSSFTSAPC